jgi:hypothetical protein
MRSALINSVVDSHPSLCHIAAMVAELEATSSASDERAT